MSGSTSDSVSVFQTQVASVLEVLLNVAVVEITKLFESVCAASDGSASGSSVAGTASKTPQSVQDELKTRAESVLGNLRKHIQSAGIRVRDASDGEKTFPSARGGAVLWERRRSANASRPGPVNEEGPPSVAVECQLTDTQHWKLSPPSTVVSSNQSEIGGVGAATCQAESGVEGAVVGENHPMKQRHSEGETRPRPPNEEGEPDTSVPPVKKEPVTLPIAVKEGEPTELLPVQERGAMELSPVQEGGAVEHSPVEEGGAMELSPEGEGGATGPSPVEEGGVMEPKPEKGGVPIIPPVEEGVATELSPVKEVGPTQATPAERGGVKQPSPVKGGRKRRVGQGTEQRGSLASKTSRGRPHPVPAPLPQGVATERTGAFGADRALRPCSVRLVNVLLIFGRGVGRRGPAAATPASRKGASSLPKDLRQHQRLHTGKRPCCFTACGDGVWRLQASRTHAHACCLCGKKFRRRKALRRHERFHTGERPYGCAHCRKAFALRKNLKRHERFHTGERPHGCPSCGKRFRLRANLKGHLRFHTGERPYSCAGCDRRFRVLRNLRRHQASHKGAGGPPGALAAGPAVPPSGQTAKDAVERE